MPLSRTEAGELTDTMLQVSIDGRVHRLREEWSEGRPGKLADIYDLAVLRAEAEIRFFEAFGPIQQLRLTDADGQAA